MTKSNLRILRPFLTVAALIVSVALTGCSGGGPAKAAQNYVDGLRLFNYPALYQSLSHQDQVDRTLDQFLTQIPLAPNVSRDWFKGVLGAQEYVIGEVKQEGDDTWIIFAHMGTSGAAELGRAGSSYWLKVSEIANQRGLARGTFLGFWTP